MDKTEQQRVIMTVIGAGAALAMYALFKLAEADVLQGRALMAAATLIGTFCGTVMVLNGPISLGRSAVGGALLAVIVTGLSQIGATRFIHIEGFFGSVLPNFYLMVLSTLPLPFWIAHARGNWHDYDTLFSEAWSIIMRTAVGFVFLGIVWLLIYLSHELLSIVGLTFIETILDIDVVPFLISGAAFGLGLAVVQELSDVIGPHLILRLLRLLLPVVLAVVAVFLLALPLRGLSGLFGGLSVGFTLMAITAAAATLITAVVDQRDDAASNSPILLRAGRILSLLLPILAVLGAAAIVLRVRQYGWTPERIFAAQIAALALGYGISYAYSALNKAQWMARIRRANVFMALTTIGLSAAALTPILNAERIATNDQMTRFADGRTHIDALDVNAMRDWGVSGIFAVQQLEAQSKLPGQEALAARLLQQSTNDYTAIAPSLRSDLAGIMPVQPAGIATEPYIAKIEEYNLAELTAACEMDMPTGGKGCVLLVLDLLPKIAGNEAIVAYYSGGQINMMTLPAGPDLAHVEWRAMGAILPQGAAGEALIRSWQTAVPQLVPAQVNTLQFSGGAMMFLEPSP